MFDRTPLLWILTPVFWDSASFKELIHEVDLVLKGHPNWQGVKIKFVLIDDTAGQDSSVHELQKNADVSVIACPYNLGHQGALVYGLRFLKDKMSDHDFVVTMDSDLQDKPSDLPALLKPLLESSPVEPRLVLVQRTKRHESVGFRTMYFFFKIFFRFLTGQIMKTGNFASYRGKTIKKVIQHPYFNICYSSTLLNLGIPVQFVGLERGDRKRGESHMDFQRLVLHGLRMLAPFSEKITVRLLIFFFLYFSSCFGFLALFLGLQKWLAAFPLSPHLIIGGFLIIFSIGSIAALLILFMLFSFPHALLLKGLKP